MKIDGGSAVPLNSLPIGGTRPLYQIAEDIRADWRVQASTRQGFWSAMYAAQPYLEAMGQLTSINDHYIAEDGEMIVRYFLGNVKSWRGDKAREIKAELREMIK